MTHPAHPSPQASVPKPLASARLILLIVSLSYVLSAGLLIAARAGNADVPWWFILGWAVCGLAGSAVSRHLPPGITPAWWTLAALLIPWMVLSLVVDIRSGIWWVVLLDIGGLAAIAYGLNLCRIAGNPPK